MSQVPGGSSTIVNTNIRKNIEYLIYMILRLLNVDKVLDACIHLNFTYCTC